METPPRLPSITEDADAAALLAAHAAGGALPFWTSQDSARAFAAAGYLDAEHPSQLSQRGADVAATWAEIKGQTAAGWRREGAFTAVSPGEFADARRGDRTAYLEEHYTPDTGPRWRR